MEKKDSISERLGAVSEWKSNFSSSSVVLGYGRRVSFPSRREIQRRLKEAFAEDLGRGDATTLATIPPTLQATGWIVAREDLVLAGMALAEGAFRFQSPRLRITAFARDGDKVRQGTKVLKVTGAARPILVGERVALNFLQRLSAVASLTARFVEAVSGTEVKILDTRKTIPGWRDLEKYAVRCGGGKNHRSALDEMILIKDNHLAALKQKTRFPIAAAVAQARRQFPRLRVEVEADRFSQVQEAVEAGADIVLLDNMTPAQLRRAVKWIDGRAETEASGGVNLKTVRGIARTGVDFISVGALTHSAPAVDLGLDFVSSHFAKR